MRIITRCEPAPKPRPSVAPPLSRRASVHWLSFAALALAVPAAAHAEKLIAVTPTQLEQIDSEAPSTVLQTLPLTGMPAGASLIGADFGPIDKKLYLLVRQTSGTCTTLVMNGDTGSLSSVGLPDWNDCFAGTRDYERLRHEDVSKLPDQLVTLGTELQFNDPNTTDGWQSWSVSNAGGGSAALIALAAENTGDSSVDNSHAVVGVELNTRALVTVMPDEDTDSNQAVTVTPVGSLGIDPAHFSSKSNTNLDRTMAGTLYLLIDSGLYRVSDSTGAATSLGAVPSGTVAVLEDLLSDGGGPTSGDHHQSGGGGLGGATLLSLASLALLLRRPGSRR